ncbi:hypothetical protein V8C35DRAFT_297608 [Trichoderma chlorosporum]
MRFTVAAAVLATSVLAQEPVSTDYTTELVTITACPETVTNCPARQQTTSVATNYIPLTTSTVYTTNIHTIISCGPEVTNCPAHSTVLSTETVAVSTTVAPVSATATPTVVATSQVWSNSTGAVYPTAPAGGASSAPVSVPVYSIPAVSSPAYSAPAASSPAVTSGYAAPTGGSAPSGPAAPVCPSSSVIAVTKSYTTVLTSVEYQTVAVACPTAPAGGAPVGGAPSGTGVAPPQVTGPAGNGTSVPPVSGAGSFTGSAVFAAVAGVAALILA